MKSGIRKRKWPLWPRTLCSFGMNLSLLGKPNLWSQGGTPWTQSPRARVRSLDFHFLAFILDVSCAFYEPQSPKKWQGSYRICGHPGPRRIDTLSVSYACEGTDKNDMANTKQGRQGLKSNLCQDMPLNGALGMGRGHWHKATGQTALCRIPPSSATVLYPTEGRVR